MLSPTRNAKAVNAAKECHNCGAKGHLAEECRSVRMFLGVDIEENEKERMLTRCYMCGRTGHTASSCTERQTRCDRCGLLGHKYVSCRVKLCARCGLSGHEVDDCGVSPFIVCSQCNSSGHLARACTTYVCRWCGKAGHRPILCPMNRKQHEKRLRFLDQQVRDTQAFHVERAHRMLKASRDAIAAIELSDLTEESQVSPAGAPTNSSNPPALSSEGSPKAEFGTPPPVSPPPIFALCYKKKSISLSSSILPQIKIKKARTTSSSCSPTTGLASGSAPSNGLTSISVPSDGLTSGSSPPDGLTSSSTPSNGLSCSSPPSNGLTCRSAPSNGLTPSGAPSNELTSSGAPSNGLMPSSSVPSALSPNDSSPADSCASLASAVCLAPAVECVQTGETSASIDVTANESRRFNSPEVNSSVETLDSEADDTSVAMQSLLAGYSEDEEDVE